MIKSVLDGLNGAVQAVGNLGNALAIVLGLVTALKANRLATLTAGLFRMENPNIDGMTRSFRQLGFVITAIGAAISIANGIIQKHNAALETQ